MFAIMLIGGMLWVLSLAGVRQDLSATFESAAPSAPVVGAQASGRNLPAASSALPAGVVTVHRCIRNGQRVYSDQPCGPDADVQTIALGEINTYSPLAAGTTPVAVNPERASTPAVTGAETERSDGLCRSIDQEIDAIDARMRAGYRRVSEEA